MNPGLTVNPRLSSCCRWSTARFATMTTSMDSVNDPDRAGADYRSRPDLAKKSVYRHGHDIDTGAESFCLRNCLNLGIKDTEGSKAPAKARLRSRVCVWIRKPEASSNKHLAASIPATIRKFQRSSDTRILLCG